MSIHYSNENTVIFTLARMNPPTPGHLYLIETLIRKALEINVSHIFIILSKTNDNEEDPIPCSEKKNVLEEKDGSGPSKSMIQSLKEKMISETSHVDLQRKIEHMKVRVECVPEIKGASPFTPLVDIVKNMKAANLIMIIGEDRIDLLNSTITYFFKWDNVHSVRGIALPREEMEDYKRKSNSPKQLKKLNIQQVPTNAMSASFVRNIVKHQEKDKFNELYSPYLDAREIPLLYNSISKGVHELPKKKEVKKGKTTKGKVIEAKEIEMIKGISELPMKTVKSVKRRAAKGGKKTVKKRRRKLYK